jgi:hypothetical protein
MYISISNDKISHEGGQKHLLKDDKYIVIFKSPNHPQTNYNQNLEDFSDYSQFSDILKNDSFLFVDIKNYKVIILRDWPGNIPFFYYYDKNEHRLLVSDNISRLAKESKGITVSKKGMSLFLNNRKHYHTHTIYNNVETLHPGLYIDMSLNNSLYSIHHWYKPYREININNRTKASQQYLGALDNVISNVIVKDNPVALMFSGGSDSVLLLDRIIKLGYTDIHLFAICVEGNNIQIDYANEKAEFYKLKVNPIFVSQKDVLASWTKLYEHCYHYLSDLRIDGIFSPSVYVYNHLNTYFNNMPSTVVWGSQYALISPMMNTGGSLKFYLLYMLKKLRFLIPLSNRKIENFVISRAFHRAPVLNKDNISKETYVAYKGLYLDCFNNQKNPEQLLDLYLSTNYNSCKHWWMDWRGKVQHIYYPNGINVYPFHDRCFQEMSMPISLKVRVGGLKNIFRMPKEYKNFFYSVLPKNIPISSVKRGNFKALPEFFSLFKNEDFYNNLIKYLRDSNNRELVELVLEDNNLTIPETYDSFLELDFLEVEKLSGILFLIIRLKTDKIEF